MRACSFFIVLKKRETMSKIEWKSEKRLLKDLIPAPYNPRQLTEKQAADLNTSLTKFNLADPIVINQDNKIIGGHQRINILKTQGVTEVDVRVPQRLLTEDEEKELNLRLNKNLGEWDFDALANFDEEMLQSVGFTEEELMLNFGLSDASQIEVDDERLNVLMVEMPESPRLKTRQSFHCEDVETYEKLKEYFKTDKPGILDIDKLKGIIK